MSTLNKTESHTELLLTRQEAHEIIALLAKELAESKSDGIVLPLGLDDESEDSVKTKN